MLKIAKSVEYALLALKYISENSNGRTVSTSEISDKLDIPYELLAKIMQHLNRNEMIISQQGTKGGYTLNQLPENISFKSILDALDYKIQMTDCLVDKPTKDDCKRVENCFLRNPISKIQDNVEKLFAETTLKNIITQ
ncbi:MAG: hypothetical protein A2V66_07970 [Ignavibacteria bacterium RBG_13_36_8]|nr:MAG: hypothetical protein A2V66_07970 [Ignavibacteria bacterium RBG_13_36_8]